MALIAPHKIVPKKPFICSKVRASKGNELHLINTRFDLIAEEIAELYKSRWAIKWGFKWLKQHSNIKNLHAR